MISVLLFFATMITHDSGIPLLPFSPSSSYALRIDNALLHSSMRENPIVLTNFSWPVRYGYLRKGDQLWISDESRTYLIDLHEWKLLHIYCSYVSVFSSSEHLGFLTQYQSSYKIVENGNATELTGQFVSIDLSSDGKALYLLRDWDMEGEIYSVKNSRVGRLMGYLPAGMQFEGEVEYVSEDQIVLVDRRTGFHEGGTIALYKLHGKVFRKDRFDGVSTLAIGNLSWLPVVIGEYLIVTGREYDTESQKAQGPLMSFRLKQIRSY